MKKETATYSHKDYLAARRWYIIDAQGKTVGRLASVVAGLVRGKMNPTFSPHLDTGDFVVIINARQVQFTGNKLQNKIYYRHTEYPGGIRQTVAGQMLSSRPEAVLENAITGMLPKTPLGRRLIKKVKIYPGPDHPHTAQQPVEFSLGE
jgi:large subunit ribosomal protein L13